MVHKINDPIFNYWNNIAQKYWDFLQVNLFLQLNLKIIVKHHHIQSNLGCMLYSNLQILASIIQKPWWGQAHILAILTTMTPNDLEGNNQMTPDSRSIQDRHPMTKFVYWSFHPSIFLQILAVLVLFFLSQMNLKVKYAVPLKTYQLCTLWSNLLSLISIPQT